MISGYDLYGAVLKLDLVRIVRMHAFGVWVVLVPDPPRFRGVDFSPLFVTDDQVRSLVAPLQSPDFLFAAFSDDSKLGTVLEDADKVRLGFLDEFSSALGVPLESKELDEVFIVLEFFLEVLEEHDGLGFGITDDEGETTLSEHEVGERIAVSNSSALCEPTWGRNGNEAVLVAAVVPDFSVEVGGRNPAIKILAKDTGYEAFN